MVGLFLGCAVSFATLDISETFLYSSTWWLCIDYSLECERMRDIDCLLLRFEQSIDSAQLSYSNLDLVAVQRDGTSVSCKPPHRAFLSSGAVPEHLYFA